MKNWTVGDFIKILERQNPDEELFIACCGFTNYDKETKTYKNGLATGIAKHDGKLFLVSDDTPFKN